VVGGPMSVINPSLIYDLQFTMHDFLLLGVQLDPGIKIGKNSRRNTPSIHTFGPPPRADNETRVEVDDHTSNSTRRGLCWG